MAKHIFTSKNTWLGGYYELALELGEKSDERLMLALSTVWSFPGVEGCYLNPNIEPDKQQRVEPSPELMETRVYGIVHLPNGLEVPCGTFVVREEEGPDWLGFYMPMGALSEAYVERGIPPDIDFLLHEATQQELDSWLAELGAHIFTAAPYRMGLIGHEVSGDAYAEEIAAQGIPEVRYFGYLWPQGDKIEYFPRNRHYEEDAGSSNRASAGIMQTITDLLRRNNSNRSETRRTESDEDINNTSAQ